MKRIGLAVFAAIPVLFGQPATSQDSFPSKSLRVVVPYPPGGTADALPQVATLDEQGIDR